MNTPYDFQAHEIWYLILIPLVVLLEYRRWRRERYATAHKVENIRDGVCARALEDKS